MGDEHEGTHFLFEVSNGGLEEDLEDVEERAEVFAAVAAVAVAFGLCDISRRYIPLCVARFVVAVSVPVELRIEEHSEGEGESHEHRGSQAGERHHGPHRVPGHRDERAYLVERHEVLDDLDPNTDRRKRSDRSVGRLSGEGLTSIQKRMQPTEVRKAENWSWCSEWEA